MKSIWMLRLFPLGLALLVMFLPRLSWSMASLRGFFGFKKDPAVTEATFCADGNCSSSKPFKQPALQPIDLNLASAAEEEIVDEKEVRGDDNSQDSQEEPPAQAPKAKKKKSSLSDAMDHFKMFVQSHPECVDSTSYEMITDMSRGTAKNLTHVVKWEDGKVKLIDSFMTGEGKGVSNVCGSNASPHGFIKMGKSDYRKDVYVKRDGKELFSEWPTCKDRNPSFEHNRIFLRGMEVGYNNNLTEGSTSVECTQGGLPYRYARLHPVSYALGNTTDGCKGFPLDKWCKWAPELRGGCIYNYDGSPSPAIQKLMSEQGSGVAPPSESQVESDSTVDSTVE